MIRKNENIFEKTNLTPLSIDLLKFLSRNPNKEFYIKEIAQYTNSSVDGCYSALIYLYKMDLVTKRKSGRNVYYSINEINPSLRYFKIFVNILEITPIIKRIEKNCNKIILFGSCSTGEDTMESDIDLFVVAENISTVKDKINTKQINQRDLKPVIVTPHALLEMKNNDRGFYDEVNKGIVLWRKRNE